jgi:hypothetical protein
MSDSVSIRLDLAESFTHRLGLHSRLRRTSPSDPVEIDRLSSVSQVLVPSLRISQPRLQVLLRLNLAVLDPTSRGAAFLDGQRRVSFDVAKLVDVQSVLTEQGLVEVSKGGGGFSGRRVGEEEETTQRQRVRVSTSNR